MSFLHLLYLVLPIPRHHSQSLQLHSFPSVQRLAKFLRSVDDVVITASSTVSKSSAVMFSGTRLGSFSHNSFRFSLISLNGSSSSLTAIVWSFTEILAFLKRLTTVVWLASFHADTSNCKAVNNDTFGKVLLELRLRSISFTKCFL